MEDEGPSPWSDEVLLPRFAAAAEQYLPMLAGCVEPSEVDELREAFRVSIELMFYASRRDDPDDHFVKGLVEVVRVAVADGGGAVREYLEVWRFRKDLISTGSWIGDVARQLRRKEVELTPELRQAVKEKDRGYMGLLKMSHARFPYLKDWKLPQPPLPLFAGRQLGMWISNHLNDFTYVTRYPDGNVMSLEMAHEEGLLPGGPKREKGGK